MDPVISLHGGYSGAWSVLSHPETGLLQLTTPGRSFHEYHLTPATDPGWIVSDIFHWLSRALKTLSAFKTPMLISKAKNGHISNAVMQMSAYHIKRPLTYSILTKPQFS